MPATIGHNFIAGGRSAAGEVILQSLDATTGEALPYSFHQATEAEVDAAARAAAAAYPRYRQLSAERRAEFLEAIAAEIDALDQDFVALVCRETALPAARIQGERGRTSNQLRLFALVLRRGDFYGARIDRARPERKPLPRVATSACSAAASKRSRIGRPVLPSRTSMDPAAGRDQVPMTASARGRKREVSISAASPPSQNAASEMAGRKASAGGPARTGAMRLRSRVRCPLLGMA